MHRSSSRKSKATGSFKNADEEAAEPFVPKSANEMMTISDGFSPLNDGSRLEKRNDYVRYFGDRKKLILMRQLMWATLEESRVEEFKAMRKSELVPGDKLYDEYVKKYMKLDNPSLERAYEKIKYRRMSAGIRLFRLIWIICSLGGTIPKAWTMLSTSSFTVAITIVTSYLLQSQTEAQNLLNGRETYLQAEGFVHNAFQMGLLVLGMLTAVQLINYMEYAWKSHGRIIREDRFNYALERRMQHSKTTPDYGLEYNTDCDPDIAMMYFTLREEENDRRGSSCFNRWYELVTLDVDEELIWNKVILPELSN